MLKSNLEVNIVAAELTLNIILKKIIFLTLQVTSLCMVSGGELAVDSGTLAPELRHWHGLLVVGTAHGTLHLLDLALDLGGRYYQSCVVLVYLVSECT